MDLLRVDCGTLPAAVHASRFRGSSGVDEIHLTVRPTDPAGFEAQLDWLRRAYASALNQLALDPGTALFRRFFCSDLANQAAALAAHPLASRHGADGGCAVSWVGQPPVPTAKVALWAYHVGDPHGGLEKTQEKTQEETQEKTQEKTLDAASLTLRRNGLCHHWTTGITSPNGVDAYQQTRGVFERYEAILRSRDLSLADHVVRTWIFLQDIDVNYRGMAAARRELFAERGLTPATHFIASSGIQGGTADAAARVALDAYAISGVRPGQIQHLAALDNLPPTHAYGVTFERATSVAYRDRTHVILSGTASIDAEGRILYPGDVERQLDRTLENMSALLDQAGASLDDMCGFIVYVRDPSDHAVAWREMRQRFGDAPIEVLVAPVCRPRWLIEVEGSAVIPAANPDLPPF